MRALVFADVLVVLATAAHAHMPGPCMPRDAALAKIEQEYRQHKVGLGLGPGGYTVYELFVAETGRWTLLRTLTNSLSCIAASGDSWMASPLKPGEPS